MCKENGVQSKAAQGQVLSSHLLTRDLAKLLNFSELWFPSLQGGHDTRCPGMRMSGWVHCALTWLSLHLPHSFILLTSLGFITVSFSFEKTSTQAHKVPVPS